MMGGFRVLQSQSVVLSQANIDTDQILPARFLSTTDRSGLGKFAFSDWRWHADGSANPDFPYNQPHNVDRSILIAGRNFGCGSSREHAPWALADLGVKVVISSEIADIFRSNCLKNGLVPIVLEEPIVEYLMSRPDEALSIDICDCAVRTSDGDEFSFHLDAFDRTCLLNGVDQMGYLLNHIQEIEQYERQSDKV